MIFNDGAAHPVRSAARDERSAALALLPVAATLDYYALPEWLQVQPLVQFAPQLIGYLAFALWASHNGSIVTRIGFQPSTLRQGVTLGVVTGTVLGCVNSLVILRLAPSLGWDITFLRDTPHARVPVLIMLPWLIAAIALFVEVNFRGFLLGRLAAIEAAVFPGARLRRLSPFALMTSTMVFAFDPFMVATFQHLHWIAVWDGLAWGLIWLMTRNLYATVVAHAVEVVIVYSAVRWALIG